MGVARSSIIMASGTIASRILGFIRTVVLALTIGVTTDAADAFGVANQLPNNVYAIIAGGVLSAVLVPQIVKARSHKDDGLGYIDRLLTLAITVFAVVTVAATLAAPFLVSIYTTGWSPAQLALATAFAYWCLPQLFFYGLYSMLGEVLNARSAFGPYMWAPVLNNLVGLIGLIAFLVVFGADPTGVRTVEQWGASQIALLSGSATLGVMAQALILFLAWRKIGIRFPLTSPGAVLDYVLQSRRLVGRLLWFWFLKSVGLFKPLLHRAQLLTELKGLRLHLLQQPQSRGLSLCFRTR